MATTPNFNWSTPDNTGLVKNGALDIRTLGDSIDASLVDLKGGTTGQVLAKASGTDMDFSWVAQDDSNAIQNSIVDAKGDLIAATADDTPARLAVGTDGQVLTADSTAATGLAWATAGTPTYTWTTYTPSNLGITVGNGTQTARYVKIGKTVFLSYKFSLGSTSAVSGSVYVGTPSTVGSASSCAVIITDAGTANYAGTGWCANSDTSVLVRPIKTSTTYGELNDSLGSLFTWTTNDDFAFFITYEEA